MPNSREQSLDEDAVFLPVSESSPQFLWSEKERLAVERLLSSGPEAFYGSLGAELPGCFLSPEEVGQIGGWARDYRFTPPPEETRGADPPEDFCSTYFPPNSDVPTPDLDLGWPEKDPWPMNGSATVHTNPPAEGEPPIREIIRQHLQKASKVVAVVADRLTDRAVIGDLHGAAARGVAVYVLLNQRSAQGSATPKRLRHPHMRVRVIGGKTFCSRKGRMVVGEMKVNFLLVDLKTVIHGSYSLTWTDAHLHRQMITVLRGPVVDSFDREFRILFASSLPVPDAPPTAAGGPAEVGRGPRGAPGLGILRESVPLGLEPGSPPSPPLRSPLDWEAMGVVPTEPCSPDGLIGQREEITLALDRSAPVLGSFTENRNQFVKLKQASEHTPPVTNYMPHQPAALNHAQPLLANTAAPEKMKRDEGLTVKDLIRRRSSEKNSNLEDRLSGRSEDRPADLNHKKTPLSPAGRERSNAVIEEEPEDSPAFESVSSSRKPLILKLPQSESFSSLSDLMKSFQPRESPPGLLRRGPNGAVSELSQSVTDLSVHTPDRNHIPAPRFKASCFDPDCLTSTIALMRKRNEDLKPSVYRSPKNVVPRERPRSSTHGLDWRRSLLELDEDLEMGVKK